MPNFVWSAKDKDGQQVLKEITADTANAAQAILLAQGFSDLTLVEDEVAGVALAGFAGRPGVLEQGLRPSAAARFEHRNNPTVSLWDAVRKGATRSKIFILMLLLFVAYQMYRGRYGSAGVLIGILILWAVFLGCVGLPSIYYKRLTAAADWNRWDEVLALVGTLKRFGRFGLVKVPETELTRYRAKAFAGMGRLQDGLSEFQQCQGRADCPSWIYKLFVAGLYATAKQHDKAIELNLKSLEEKPTSVGWSDLAYRYAKYKRDPQKARQAMLEAAKSPVNETAKPFRANCAGVIAYLESDYATARRELETAIELLQKPKWRPYRDGHLAVSRAYLCCVLANQGDLSTAKGNFALAKEYLIATGEDYLLSECRRATGEYN